MDIAKLKIALKNVYEYINQHSRDPSNKLEDAAKEIIKEQCPDIGQFALNVGYSDDLNKKLFYLDLPSKQQILIYSPLLDQPLDLIKLGRVKPLKLIQCQERLLKGLDRRRAEYINILMKADIKGQMRLITSLIACYIPENKAAKQLIKEILEDFYIEAIVE